MWRPIAEKREERAEATLGRRSRLLPNGAGNLASVRSRLGLLVCAGLVLLALLVRLQAITAPPLDFAPARQTYDALGARIIYLDASHQLPGGKRAVLDQVRRQVPQIEPPVMEHLAAAGYRLVGSEQLWIPRLISVMFWLVGGGFVYRLAARLSRKPGPLISLALYLLLPFGIFGSRSFQPDPLMVMLSLGAFVAVVRFHERPSTKNLGLASGASALATLSKPAIPIFFLWGLFLALAIARQGLRRAVSSPYSLAFAAISFAPAAAYYVWGTVVNGFLRGHTTSSLDPTLLIQPSFWRGWMGMIASVVAYPLNGLSGIVGLIIDLALISLVVLGLITTRSREGVALLSGLWIGYFVFGLAFTTHISTHSYYSLPLIPIIALSLAPVAVAACERLRGASRVAQASLALVCCLGAAGAALKVEERLWSRDYLRQVEVYQQVGTVVGHTTAAVHVDPSYDAPLLYYAWIASSPLYYPEGQRLQPSQIQQRLRQIETESGRPRFLIITAVTELQTQPRLRAFVRRLPVVSRTRDYSIFALPRA
jgi:4-amino-4-deoxy-L-arabinose transferase-like glycosyltransferase